MKRRGILAILLATALIGFIIYPAARLKDSITVKRSIWQFRCV